MSNPTIKARADTIRAKIAPAVLKLVHVSNALLDRLNAGSKGFTEGDPLLQWLSFTGVTVFAFVLSWFFGLLNKMLSEDPTHISAAILVIYIATSAHCCLRAGAVSREAREAQDARRLVIEHGSLGNLASSRLRGSVAEHIRDLKVKAELQGAGQLNQQLLLRVLAERLRGSNAFGSFASDTLMKLGLLGTIVGFIMMLAPMATLDPENQAALRMSMGTMSGGMAVAMYTTLAGLIGSVLLRIQYQFLDTATSRIFTSAVELTEVHVIPALERARGGPVIEDFSGLPREAEFDPFSVVLFKALQAIAFLFFIALVIIAPQETKGKVDSKAEFMISMNWPDNSPEDLDLFVQDPIGNVAWYRRREAGFMVLERDNRGGINNFIMVNGEKVLSPIRQEVVSIRGIVAGEYTVNAYNFLAQNPSPLPVTVTVEKLNPKVTIISKETIILDHGGQEKTAVRFTIDQDGKVTGTSKEDRSILQTFYDPNRNGMVQ